MPLLNHVLDRAGSSDRLSSRYISLGLVVRSWHAATRIADLLPLLESARRDDDLTLSFDGVGRATGWTLKVAAPSVPSGTVDAVCSLRGAFVTRGLLPAWLISQAASVPPSATRLAYRRAQRGRVVTRSWALDRDAAAGRRLLRLRAAAAASGDPLTSRKDLLHNVESALRDAHAVGELLVALARSPIYGAMPAPTAIVYADRWIATRQHRLYRDADGEPAGLLAWGWFSSWTLDDMASGGPGPHHRPLGEWNEGDRLCVTDLSFVPAICDAICADVAGEWHPDAPELLVCRYSKDGAEVTPWPADRRGELAASIRRAAAAPADEGATR